MSVRHYHQAEFLEFTRLVRRLVYSCKLLEETQMPNTTEMAGFIYLMSCTFLIGSAKVKHI